MGSQDDPLKDGEILLDSLPGAAAVVLTRSLGPGTVVTSHGTTRVSQLWEGRKVWARSSGGEVFPKGQAVPPGSNGRFPRDLSLSSGRSRRGGYFPKSRFK